MHPFPYLVPALGIITKQEALGDPGNWSGGSRTGRYLVVISPDSRAACFNGVGLQGRSGFCGSEGSEALELLF
jgi:hypothetical protein